MLKRKLQKLLIVTMVCSLLFGNSFPIYTSIDTTNPKLRQLIDNWT